MTETSQPTITPEMTMEEMISTATITTYKKEEWQRVHVAKLHMKVGVRFRIR